MKFRIISPPEFFRRIIRRKPLRSATTLKTPLNRCLNLAHLTAFCVSTIIGTGLYDLAGQLVRKYTGPSTAFNYLIVTITVVSTALCLAELTTLMPRAGSLYIYTYVTFGECAAFCIGWSMVSVMILNASATAKAFSEAVNRLTNGTIRHWSNANLPSLGNSEIFDSTPDLLAMGFLILLALATLSGAYISMTATLVFSGLTVVILIALSVSCFVLGDVNNFHGEGSFLPYGFKGLLEGTLLSIFIISGFEYVANASEEAIDPRRDIPIALVLSILTCTMSNLLISFGIAYVVPHWKISDSLSLIHAFNLTKEPYVSLLAAIGCILAIGPAKIVTMYTISRMLYAISSEGLLFPCLATIDRRTKVPLWSLLVGSVISVVLAGFFNLSTFVQTGAFSALLTYFLVGVQLFLFRYVLEEDVTAIEVDNDNNEHGVPTRKPLTKTHLSKSVCTMRKGVPTFLTRLEGKSWFVGILTVFVGLVLVSGGVINLTQGTTAWIVTGVSEVLVLITAALLCLYRPNEFYGAFQTPIMPVAPCITILANGILITSMESLTWLRFVIWSAVGLVIYFSYGIWFSKADEEPESKELNQLNVGDRYKVPDPQNDQT